jgi:hypothetical protein
MAKALSRKSFDLCRFFWTFSLKHHAVGSQPRIASTAATQRGKCLEAKKENVCHFDRNLQTELCKLGALPSADPQCRKFLNHLRGYRGEYRPPFHPGAPRCPS